MNSIHFSIILILSLFSQQIQSDFNSQFKEPLFATSSPEQIFTVIPAATGKQLVRYSLPLPRGFLTETKALEITAGKKTMRAGFRPLSWYPVKRGEPISVRRAMVTFPFNFADFKPFTFKVSIIDQELQSLPNLPVSLSIINNNITVSWKNGTNVHLKLLAPECKSFEAQPMEIVETNNFYLWQRLHIPDPQWPRIIEMRLDVTGGVTIIAHLLKVGGEDGFAPELGWEMRSDEKLAHGQLGSSIVELKDQEISHSFINGTEALWVLGKDALAVYHPAAPLKRRGKIDVSRTKDGKLLYRYLRCTAEKQVPMQPFSWQRIEIVLATPQLALLPPTLESPHDIKVLPKLWDELYATSPELPVDLPTDLARLLNYHHDAIISSSCVGDDWGNVTSYTDIDAHGSVYGMNRLNHCAPIFLDRWQYGDHKLIETALLWCDNFHDQSIWWGDPERGGTRYINIIRLGKTPLTMEYMWRSNSSSTFCTKGYDAFWLAWEQTGDPRMKESFNAQIAYAMEHVHALKNDCRNIGNVRDFIHLYSYTGEEIYFNEALRLFRELRTQLSTGDLFDQSGKPLDPDPPFIEEDKNGLKIGYAKPYIIGYALIGLPELLHYAPNEPKLRDVVQAVANFLVDSQDPVGGWRYPHPRSSKVFMSLALESAWQIMQASRILGPDEKFLNAIEAVLRQRLHGWLNTGKVFNQLSGWEISTGKVKSDLELPDLYKKPTDRDISRDYTDGIASFGTTQPEGLVYLREVLAYYLQHRPVTRILELPDPEEPLGKVLKRVPYKDK